jgi:hypothetical protein
MASPVVSLSILLQGRFKSQLVKDETYFWSVSRYIRR